MQTAIDKVMCAYTLIAHLTPDEARATRDRLTAYLASMDADENVLAVEGMRFLRGTDRVAKRRAAKNPKTTNAQSRTASSS
jgi:hypothetical protein